MEKKSWFKKTINPSFLGLFGIDTSEVKEKNSFTTLRKKLSEEKELHKKHAQKFGEVSHATFCYQIAKERLTPEDLEVLLQTQLKRKAVNYFIMIFSLIFLLQTTVAYLFFDTWLLWPVVCLACFIKSAVNVIDYLHKAKQILVGATFPRYYMIWYPKNVLRLDEGVFKKELIFKARPVTAEMYQNIVAIYKEDEASKNGESNINKRNNMDT